MRIHSATAFGILLAAMASIGFCYAALAQSGGGAAAVQKLPARMVALDRVYFSNFTASPAFQLVRAGGEPVTIYGAAVAFEEDGRELVATVEGKTTRARGKGAKLKLGKRSILLARVVLPPPLAGEDQTELAEAWVWAPAEGSAVRFGRETLVGLDLDLDGKFWEPGEDGVVHPDSSYVVPLGTTLVVGNATWTLEPPKDDGGGGDGNDEDSVPANGMVRASVREDRGIDGDGAELEAVRLWNDYRVKAGLPAAWLDKTLSEEAALHCHYLQLNPGDAHDEFPNKPGYTEAGKASGLRSCILTADEAQRTVLDMLTQLFHKRQLIDAKTVRIGVAARHGNTLLDGLGGREDRTADARVRWPMGFPAHDQTVVERPYMHENPPSLPADARPGASILLMFRDLNPGVTLVAARLARAAGNGWQPVELYITSPDKPANAARPGNDGSVCLWPKAPLPGGSTYRATVQYTERGGKPRTRDWLFHTR